MDIEKGTIGLIGWSNQRLSVDGWEIDHSHRTVKAFCDLERFKDRFNLTLVEYRPVLGSEWLVRFDNEDHIYYGSTRCMGMSFHDSVNLDIPSEEHLGDSLILHFQFQHFNYGPFRLVEARAMARRGNDMFFDLLTLEEMDRLAGTGDPQFTSYVNSKIFY